MKQHSSFSTVESCPLTKLNGGLSRLHCADEDAVSWLTSYGLWHAYKKKKKQETQDFISPDLCPPNSPVDDIVCELMQEGVTLYKQLHAIPAAVTSDLEQRLIRKVSHCTNSCTRYQPLWQATWSSASSTHVQAYHKTSSTKQFVNEESDYVQAWRQKDITLNICWTKTGSFQSQHTTEPAVSEPPTVYRGKHVVSHYFHRSHLNANEVSKSEVQGKLQTHITFENVLTLLTKYYQNWSTLVEATACQVGALFSLDTVSI